MLLFLFHPMPRCLFPLTRSFPLNLDVMALRTLFSLLLLASIGTLTSCDSSDAEVGPEGETVLPTLLPLDMGTA